jgi:RNA polymerase sigma-70 factor (ECF subfamily)
MDTDDTLASDLADCLDRLAAGDAAARDRILELTQARLRVLAHRLLHQFPQVRRWEETDDVLQNASLRLHRALAEVHPGSARDLLALAARQIHRELIDLAWEALKAQRPEIVEQIRIATSAHQAAQTEDMR